MLLYYILLLTIISTSFSLKLVFDGEELLNNISETYRSDKRLETCNKSFIDLVENEYICVNKNDTQISKSFEMIKDLINLCIDHITIPTYLLTLMYLENKEVYDKIKNNYNTFYYDSIPLIKIIGRKLAIYYLDKFNYLYESIQIILKSYITINQADEEIILPDGKKIIYFTSNTINKYSNCEEFIGSLYNMKCFTVKKEILNKYVQMALEKLKN